MESLILSFIFFINFYYYVEICFYFDFIKMY